MAASDAKPVPIKATAYRVTFCIVDADGDLVSGATGLDSEVSKDGAAFADCTNEATEIATASGMYFLDLTATEMDADTVAVIVKTTSVGAKTTPIVLYPQEAGDILVTVENLAAIADALLDRDMATGTDSGSPTVRTVRQALRFLRNKWDVASGTLTVRKEDDVTASWTAVVSSSSTADAVTGLDPQGP